MDFIIFIAGYKFGAKTGAGIGVLTWLIYGIINPYGFSLPIFIATLTGESLFGIVGGILGRIRSQINNRSTAESLKFAIIGFLITFVYDQYTNIVFGFVAGIPISVALISGIPFSIIHELSNAIIFFVGASPSIYAIDRLFKGG